MTKPAPEAMKADRCDRCDRPLATDADYDTVREGEGVHLCWREYGTLCEAIDWRAALNAWQRRAEAAERNVTMVMASLEGTERERDAMRADLAAALADADACQHFSTRAQRAEARAERAEERLTFAQAKAAVCGGEWCAQNRAEGRGPCGACAWCCSQATARAEQAETALVGLATVAAAVTCGRQEAPAVFWRHVDALSAALASTTDLAARTCARLRAEALDEAAEALVNPDGGPERQDVYDGRDAAAWLRARAEAERSRG